MRPYRILLCAALAAFLVACGDAYPQTVIKTKDGKVVIQLKDAGAEPRKRLQYQLEEGEAAKMDIAMEMAMRQKVRGRTNTMAPMKMAMRMAFGPATRTDDGNLRLDFSLEKVDMVALGNAPVAALRKGEGGGAAEYGDDGDPDQDFVSSVHGRVSGHGFLRASGCAEGGSDHRLQVCEEVVVCKDSGDLFPISFDLQRLRFEEL